MVARLYVTSMRLSDGDAAGQDALPCDKFTTRVVATQEFALNTVNDL